VAEWWVWLFRHSTNLKEKRKTRNTYPPKAKIIKPTRTNTKQIQTITHKKTNEHRQTTTHTNTTKQNNKHKQAQQKKQNTQKQTEKNSPELV